MFSITADFDLNEINRVIEEETKAWFDGIVNSYRTAGKLFVERAVAKATFNNITFNLRSSIGYLIIYNGKVFEYYFKDLKDGTEGQEVGRDYAEFIASQINEGEGLSMACVAGEEYAAFVEAKGRDVIRVSSAFFETELKALLA